MVTSNQTNINNNNDINTDDYNDILWGLAQGPHCSSISLSYKAPINIPNYVSLKFNIYFACLS